MLVQQQSIITSSTSGVLWPVFHTITASTRIDNLRTGTTVNADLCLNGRLHQTGVKSKENKKAAQRWSKYFFAFTLTTLQRSKISALLKNPCSPLQGVWAKTQWYTLHPSEGSLPWHDLMANLAITADSQFPQMSQWLGTWASMHMHTHAALAQCTFWGDSVYISHRMASCPTLVSLHVSVGMAACMFCMVRWLDKWI